MLSQNAEENLIDIIVHFVHDRKKFTAFDVTSEFRIKFPRIIASHDDIKQFVNDHMDLSLFNYNCQMTSFSDTTGNYFAKQYFPKSNEDNTCCTTSTPYTADKICKFFEINIPIGSVDKDEKGRYTFKEQKEEDMKDEEKDENKEEQNAIIEKYCSGSMKLKFQYKDDTDTSLIIKEYELFLLKVEEIIGSAIIKAKITFNSEY